MHGVVEGHAVVVGRERLLAEWGLSVPAELADAKADAEAAGRTAVLAGWDGAVRGLLLVADTVQADVRARPYGSCAISACTRSC